jgi:hypothetical protein
MSGLDFGDLDISGGLDFEDTESSGLDYETELGLNVLLTVTRIEGGVRVTATDPNGVTSATVYDGKTPVKGVDYLTEEDIEELTEQIAEAITYTHNQMQASSVWDIVHNMGKMPSVTVVDSGDNMVFGEVQYISMNELVVSFSSAFSGKAYLN